METDNRKNRLILIVLGLALLVQVFNAASLYHSFSNLSDILKFLGSAFIGISAEIGIFTCVYAGSDTAGKYFAVLSFFVGILFHSTFTELSEIDFLTTRRFIASSLMQIINSSLVWFLSDQYVKRTEGEKAKTDYKKIKQEITELKANHRFFVQANNRVNEETVILEQKKAELEQEVKRLQKSKAGLSHN
jgi:hypothetical protein